MLNLFRSSADRRRPANRLRGSRTLGSGSPGAISGPKTTYSKRSRYSIQLLRGRIRLRRHGFCSECGFGQGALSKSLTFNSFAIRAGNAGQFGQPVSSVRREYPAIDGRTLHHPCVPSSFDRMTSSGWSRTGCVLGRWQQWPKRAFPTASDRRRVPWG